MKSMPKWMQQQQAAERASKKRRAAKEGEAIYALIRAEREAKQKPSDALSPSPSPRRSP